MVILVLIVSLTFGPIALATTSLTANEENNTGSEIVAVHPNPVAKGDAGEFVIIRVPNGTNVSGWQLRDDESTVSLPNTTVGGRIVLSTEQKAVENATDRDARPLAGEISLANGGEQLQLVKTNETIASVEYTDAPEGELYRREQENWSWQPLGATDLPVIEGNGSTARAFVLPDSPKTVISAITASEDRILIGGYTFTSKPVARALIRAHKRGVHVELLIESGPVGGITRRQATLLDRLTQADIPVHVLGGDRARYEYHHAKYAVIDDRALVLTENWKPSGVGGTSSRGWGSLVRDPEIANGLSEVFEADTGWKDTVAWRTFKKNESFESDEFGPQKSYPTEFEPETVEVETSQLLVAPDNAAPRMISLMDNATDSLRIVQVSVEGPNGNFTEAALRAARRGVEVRILLSSAWYTKEENRRLAKQLNRRAKTENLPLTVALAEPNGQYEKIHAKGVIIDGDQVILGSLNWNPTSAHENREVVVVLEGEGIGRYYSDVFDADWKGGKPQLPLPGGIIALIGIAILTALVFAKIRYGNEIERRLTP